MRDQGPRGPRSDNTDTADHGKANGSTGLGGYPIYVYPRSLWPAWYRPPWESDVDRCPCCDRTVA